MKILLVEDEQTIALTLTDDLEGAGYEVAQVPDAHRARELVSNEMPDLILLDWMMPGMNGLEFAKWLKRDDRLADIPIIMLTARDDENYKVQGLDAGVDDPTGVSTSAANHSGHGPQRRIGLGKPARQRRALVNVAST